MALDRAPANPRMPGAFVNRDGTLSRDGLVVLEEMWRQVAAGATVTPCAASTALNVITLTPILHREGAATYGDHLVYAFVADATSNGAVTGRVRTAAGEALATVKVYVNGGAAQAGSGDVTTGRLYLAAYNSALDTGAGGLVLIGGLSVSVLLSVLGSILTTQGDLLTRDASTVVRLPVGAAGTLLRSDGTDPSWATLTAFLDAVFAGEANGDLVGRTGGSWTNRTLAAVLADMLTTRGDVIRRGASAPERLALGAAGTIFRSDGTDAAWATVATALATLVTARGDLITRDASTPVRLALGASGTVLRSDGTDAAWATIAASLASLLTTRGDIITRDASAVIRLALGAANTFLGSDGTDASWRTAAQALASLNIVVGNYAPTMTLTANLDSASASAMRYIRFGSLAVIVFGLFGADATAAAGTATTLGMSVPIASNFTATNEAGGVALDGATTNTVRVSSDSANDRLTLQWASQSTASQTFGLIAGYLLL